RRPASGTELLSQALVDHLRVGLARGLSHDLADEVAEDALLTGLEGRDLCFVRRKHPFDARVELCFVADRGLGEVALGREVAVSARCHRLDERGTRNHLTRVRE